jgi:hypothetical protein
MNLNKEKRIHSEVASIDNSAISWLIILVFFTLVIVLAFLGGGKILNYFYPATVLAISIYLYSRAPGLYNGFVWWVVFLSPFIRRISDFYSAFTNPSPILLAPYLVTLVCGLSLYKQLPKVSYQGGLPFLLSLIGIVYSFLIATVSRTPTIAIRGLLDWVSPLLFGCHLYLNWLNYPLYQHNTQRVFTWGVLILGLYGVIQYLVAPQWDGFWIISASFDALQPGFSEPQPQGIRVFSTLNSQEPFSAIMSSGLLLLLSSRSIITLPASTFGYLSLLLSSVRSAWFGWLAGFLTFATSSLSAKFQIRLISGLLVASICILPLIGSEQFSTVIHNRIATFSTLSQDGSSLARQATYMDVLDKGIVNFVGDGIGGDTYDSAILSILMNLGWLGGLPYILGMVLALLGLFKSQAKNSDFFFFATRSVVISSFIRFPINSPMLEASGMILWGFIGLGLAAVKYYDSERSYNSSEADFTN